MKEVLLSNGMTALVDDEDYLLVSQYKWLLGSKGYAIAKTRKPDGSRTIILMHRLINQTPEGLKTDHINGNTLNNRRANLRTATITENTRNQKRRSTNTSGYKGVSYNKRTGRWEAKIIVDKKLKHLGYYETAQKAAKAYNSAAMAYFGDYARLNDIAE